MKEKGRATAENRRYPGKIDEIYSGGAKEHPLFLFQTLNQAFQENHFLAKQKMLRI